MFQQKYLDSKKQYEIEIAYMQDKYQKDCEFYQNKADKYKEKSKRGLREMDNLKRKLLQT